MLSNDPAAIYFPEDLSAWLIRKAYAQHNGSFRQALFDVVRDAKRREDTARVDAAKADPSFDLWDGMTATQHRPPPCGE